MIKPNTRARGLGGGLQLGLCTSFLFEKKKRKATSHLSFERIYCYV